MKNGSFTPPCLGQFPLCFGALWPSYPRLKSNYQVVPLGPRRSPFRARRGHGQIPDVFHASHLKVVGANGAKSRLAKNCHRSPQRSPDSPLQRGVGFARVRFGGRGEARRPVPDSRARPVPVISGRQRMAFSLAASAGRLARSTNLHRASEQSLSHSLALFLSPFRFL